MTSHEGFLWHGLRYVDALCIYIYIYLYLIMYALISQRTRHTSLSMVHEPMAAEAVHQCGSAIQFASSALREDPEILSHAVGPSALGAEVGFKGGMDI